MSVEYLHGASGFFIVTIHLTLNKTSCILYLEIVDGNYQIILHDFRFYVNGT